MNDAAPSPLGKTHLVICGLPRSGATLLYTMIRTGHDSPIEFPPSTTAAVDADAPARHIVSKRPQDIFEIDAIVDAAAAKGKSARFVVTMRDIRGLALARHVSFAHQPAFGAEHGLAIGRDLVGYSDPGLLAYCEAIEKARLRTDIALHVCRYENMLRAPDAEIARLVDFSGINEWGASAARDEQPSPAPITPHGGAKRLDPWRSDPAAAAYIVRLFRLAPRLFDYLAAWGYEADRRWHDELAAFAPAGLDDDPGMIVAFHTDDLPYTREAARLTASASRLGLPIEVVQIPSQGDWIANNRYKVAFIKAARERHRGPLLYIDIDTVIHADPWPVLRGYSGDVAVCTRNGGAIGATILLGDTAGAWTFIDDWGRRLSRLEEALPVKMLNKILRDQRRGRPVGYSVQLLPAALCQPFEDTGATSPAIIELLHAGRERKTAAEASEGPIARRHRRIAELDALFSTNGS